MVNRLKLALIWPQKFSYADENWKCLSYFCFILLRSCTKRESDSLCCVHSMETAHTSTAPEDFFLSEVHYLSAFVLIPLFTLLLQAHVFDMNFPSPFCEPQIKTCLIYTKLSFIIGSINLSGKEFPDKVKESLGLVSTWERGTYI